MPVLKYWDPSAGGGAGAWVTIIGDEHTHDDRYVNVTGDTMVGELVLEGGLKIAPSPSGTAVGHVWTSTGTDGDGDWAQPSAILADLVSDPVLINWFGADEKADAWSQIDGAGSAYWYDDAASPTVPGVYRLAMGASQSVMVAWTNGSPLPYGTDDLYRIRVRGKGNSQFVSGGGTVDVGFVCYGADRTSIVDRDNGTNLLLPHTAVNAFVIPLGSADLYIDIPDSGDGAGAAAYISGRAEYDAGDPVNSVKARPLPAANSFADWNTALMVAMNTRYWRPYVRVVNGANAGAVFDIDSLEVYRLDATVKVPNGIIATTVQSTTGIIENLTASTLLVEDSVRLPVLQEDIDAGGIEGYVWQAIDDFGNGRWMTETPPVNVTETEPATPETGELWFKPSRDFLPFYVAYTPNISVSATVTADSTWRDLSGPGAWETVSIDIPCNGLLRVRFEVLLKGTSAGTLLAYRPLVLAAQNVTATRLVGSQDNGQARWINAGTTATEHLAVGFTDFELTGVPADGGNLEFKHQLYVATGGTGSGARYPRWFLEFIPYGNERLVKLP